MLLLNLTGIGLSEGLDKDFHKSDPPSKRAKGLGQPAELLSPPAHACLGLLNQNALRGEFGANCVGLCEFLGGTGGFHLIDFVIDLLVRERVRAEDFNKLGTDFSFATL